MPMCDWSSNVCSSDLEEGAPESSSMCSFTGTRGEPACGGEGGGWSGGSVSQGCDPHGLHSWFIHFHPKLNFSATLPALTHRHLHATRSYFPRQPIHAAEPCVCLRCIYQASSKFIPCGVWYVHHLPHPSMALHCSVPTHTPVYLDCTWKKLQPNLLSSSSTLVVSNLPRPAINH